MNQAVLQQTGLTMATRIHYNLPVSKLVEETIIKKQGTLTNSGALACDTGRFTGRSPRDKYVVADACTQNTIWWGDVNHPL